MTKVVLNLYGKGVGVTVEVDPAETTPEEAIALLDVYRELSSDVPGYDMRISAKDRDGTSDMAAERDKLRRTIAARKAKAG